MESVLPDGCPVIIGGGLIRDALYGGRPNDIDIWLPSNITIPDVDAFCAHLVRTGYGPQQGFQGQIIFRGPGSRVEEVEDFPHGILGGFDNAENDNAGYGDVHNHWVIEIQTAPGLMTAETPGRNHPKVNIMRNMARWNGDAPAFFTEIMRNFDLDLCMYFVGYMPGQTSVNTVIMPQHLLDSLTTRRNGRIDIARLNEVYWNQARLETTSTERILGRIRKMNQKYQSLGLPEDIERISMIPTAEIIAVPVLFSHLMPVFNSNAGWGWAPLPTLSNRLTEAQYAGAWERAQAAYAAWRNSHATRGITVGLNVTPMAFMTYNA